MPHTDHISALEKLAMFIGFIFVVGLVIVLLLTPDGKMPRRARQFV